VGVGTFIPMEKILLQNIINGVEKSEELIIWKKKNLLKFTKKINNNLDANDIGNLINRHPQVFIRTNLPKEQYCILSQLRYLFTTKIINYLQNDFIEFKILAGMIGKPIDSNHKGGLELFKIASQYSEFNIKMIVENKKYSFALRNSNSNSLANAMSNLSITSTIPTVPIMPTMSNMPIMPTMSSMSNIPIITIAPPPCLVQDTSEVVPVTLQESTFQPILTTHMGPTYADITEEDQEIHHHPHHRNVSTLEEYFHRKTSKKSFKKSYFLASGIEQAKEHFKDFALLGHLPDVEERLQDDHEDEDGDNDVDVNSSSAYINTGEPFCIATIGVQGSGKSHTLNCILESCLIPMALHDINHLHHPMTALVLHFDQTITSVCEATGLVCVNETLQTILTNLMKEKECEEKKEMQSVSNDDDDSYDDLDGESRAKDEVPSCCLSREKMVVLVSPTYYYQRKNFYGDYCVVKPLLFDWTKLTADHIRRFMKLEENDNQLYISSMMDLLRGYQRQNKVPQFHDFVNEVKQICKLPGQGAALTMRLNLLESIIKQSDKNAHLQEESTDLLSECRHSVGGKMIVVDFTDPLLTSSDVNGIFQVLTEQFRSEKTVKGKLLVLDEAHRYMDGQREDGLSRAIVDVARLMRHDGMRLAISTQSPKVLAPELLELISSVVMHRFHSKDWFEYLSLKLGLNEEIIDELFRLNTGEAYVFASRNLIDSNQKIFRVDIRPRLTADRGTSVRNTQKKV
jgi:hypothetical protein